jgi:hypothetical protein
MTKRQMIDEILTVNKTAAPAFLARFDETELSRYLQHLNVLKTPRLFGDPHRFDRYFVSDAWPRRAAGSAPAPISVPAAVEPVTTTAIVLVEKPAPAVSEVPAAEPVVEVAAEASSASSAAAAVAASAQAEPATALAETPRDEEPVTAEEAAGLRGSYEPEDTGEDSLDLNEPAAVAETDDYTDYAADEAVKADDDTVAVGAKTAEESNRGASAEVEQEADTWLF